jgi:hypothetical protein
VPGARIDASVRAADARDIEAVPDLIALLDSEDPATRLIAENALEWILGREIDFDHAGTWAQRRADVERLRQAYLAGELVPEAGLANGPTNGPASEPSSEPELGQQPESLPVPEGNPQAGPEPLSGPKPIEVNTDHLRVDLNRGETRTDHVQGAAKSAGGGASG